MSELKLTTPLHAWVYLNRVIEGPSHTLHALLEEYPVDEIAHGIYHQADWIGALREETAARRDWLRQDEDIASAEKVGARLITPESPEWPAEEFSRSFGFFGHGGVDAPSTFGSQAVPPHALWVRGGDLRGLVAQSVAVVGTRAITRYGREATRMFAADFAQNHWTVVSGGALGVDSAAHEMAMEAGGQTVAINSCGIDYVYPARNEKMFDEIAQAGAIVAEFPPGTTPQRHRFLSRNRLTAALTAGTVVVEAAFRSGALNTMNWAEAFGRVTMAVPGPVTTTGSLGCHLRIQDGRAQLVTSGEEARALMSKVGTVDPGGQYELEFSASTSQRLSRNELRIFDATPPTHAECGVSAEEIARDAGMRLPLCIHILVALEKQGIVTRQGRVWQRAIDE
ncbi:DNA protecting protein DprA [Corynebacterium camporealensis]|uniref:DNA protecting protein DprA n=1 Tax=Corynebacterium camporealensis TaxID=161896 RepID=A0A0F6QWI9_9CORY|nr:DNA-processing protein DprA [Corynebacterium camporealensis]AKE39427.1 DNA protecting protein DprA [Corynebacterium camporealensis]AVH88591.1 DNA protecting protein DprA [Corynebacterium camporealensis]